MAAVKGQVECLRILLDKGASVNQANNVSLAKSVQVAVPL
jgi:hypothetical protein